MGRAYGSRPSQLLSLPADQFEALAVDSVCYFAGLAESMDAEEELIEQWKAQTGGKGLTPPITITRQARAV